jgi:cellulose synthase/poly-beta-1,6-N-acetylglucosamine synthase-like glycosyltransferase
MPSISALIHTCNDERRLGRTLETLRACDEIVIVDHESQDGTAKVARDYGAKVVAAVTGVQDGAYANDCKHDWVLCVLPIESLTEALEASLLEWKLNAPAEDSAGYAVTIRSSEDGQAITQELRLVNRTKLNWQGIMPESFSGLPALEGDLLRFDASSE